MIILIFAMLVSLMTVFGNRYDINEVESQESNNTEEQKEDVFKDANTASWSMGHGAKKQIER